MTAPSESRQPASHEPLVLHREQRFYVSLLANQRPRVVMTGAWDRSVAAYMREHELTDISLNSGMGWRDGTLDFIGEIARLRSIAVLDAKTRDLLPLVQHASTLEEVIAECNPTAVPRLAELPRLKHLNFTWKPGWKPIFDGGVHRLQQLAVGNWPFADLAPLATLADLRQFTIVRGRGLRDLSALRACSALRGLVLESCHAVDSTDPIRACAELERLELRSRSVGDVDFAAELTRLRGLFVGKSDVSTLAPLAGCVELERFGTEGRVLDGDLSLLLRLPRFQWAVLRNRPEYRPSVAEVNETCSRRARAQ